MVSGTKKLFAVTAGFALLCVVLVLLVGTADRDRWFRSSLDGLELALFAGVVSVLGVLVGASLRKGSFARKVAASLAILVVVAACLVLQSARHGGGRELETRALSNLRRFAEAQQTYASFNGGFFESRTECLLEPRPCLVDYRGGARSYLGPRDLFTSRGVVDGYRFLHFSARPVDPLREPGRGEVSRTSVEAFAVVATPMTESRTGRARSFCVDSSGAACYTARGRLPVVIDGRCESCAPTDLFQ